MKRTSIIGVVFIALALWLATPLAAGGHFKTAAANTQDLADATVLNHHGERYTGHHSGQGGCRY
ncbi:MAG: hypothetical protein ACFBSF_17870 [Leptolyngbyaceae cyanobacterium]